MKRILPATSICKSLWADEKLRLSAGMSQRYLDRLDSQELSSLAADQSQANGEPGGVSDDDADRHFALRFVNSAGRSLYAALDPNQKLGRVSDCLLGPTLGEGVLIVDVPCGAGAAGLALLDGIRELRLHGALPTLPLEVRIVAGDISDRARAHYRELLESARHDLELIGISVDMVDCHWDVSDARSNATFVDRVVEGAAGISQVLVVASNFSDAMADVTLFEHFRHFTSQLAGRLARWPTTFCWIEPPSNKARKYLVPLSAWVENFVAWLKSDAKTYAVSEYEMHDPVANKSFKSGITVLECRSDLAV